MSSLEFSCAARFFWSSFEVQLGRFLNEFLSAGESFICQMVLGTKEVAGDLSTGLPLLATSDPDSASLFLSGNMLTPSTAGQEKFSVGFADLAYPKAARREGPQRVDICRMPTPANPTPLNSSMSSGPTGLESAERQKSAKSRQ